MTAPCVLQCVTVCTDIGLGVMARMSRVASDWFIRTRMFARVSQGCCVAPNGEEAAPTRGSRLPLEEPDLISIQVGF